MNGQLAAIQPIVPQSRTPPNSFCASVMLAKAMVFVTERDTQTGPYASEGILQSADPLTANPQYTRRPSYYAVQTLIRQYRDVRQVFADIHGST